MIPNMYRAGAPVDIYDISDLPRLVERGWHRQYKLFHFVNAFHLSRDERSLIDTHLKRDGRTLAFFFAPKHGLLAARAKARAALAEGSAL